MNVPNAIPPLTRLEINGTELGPGFGLEITDSYTYEPRFVDRQLYLAGPPKAVWLTRSIAPQGPYHRLVRLNPDDRVVAAWEGWIMECDGTGEGTFRAVGEPPEVETREQVFEALLKSWRDSHWALLQEFGAGSDEKGAEVDRVLEKWRERYRRARNEGKLA